MDKRPKRRKSKDNPYTIFEENGKFYVVFKDGQGDENKVGSMSIVGVIRKMK